MSASQAEYGGSIPPTRFGLVGKELEHLNCQRLSAKAAVKNLQVSVQDVLTECVMIRPITPDDTVALLDLADSIGLFSSSEREELSQMLTDSLNNEGDAYPFSIVDDDAGLVGLAYCEPERMTIGTWNLQLIAVHPTHQRQGRGAKLLHFVEQILIDRGARILLVETMGTSDFEYVRTFYRNSGYAQEARIREFYAKGADKIIFRKVLSSQGVSKE